MTELVFCNKWDRCGHRNGALCSSVSVIDPVQKLMKLGLGKRHLLWKMGTAAISDNVTL